MENNKLGKKIRDWAISLGFRLPDGSSPPANYFVLLTATPHRRQLWEAVVESIQTRQKVQHIRKQILAAKLQDENKFSKSTSIQVTDRIELWHKQNCLENEIREKRIAVNNLEKNIMAKASDLLFEICSLAELEKHFEDLEEKSLVLKLFSKREKKIMETFEAKFLKEGRVLNLNDNLGNVVDKENPESFINELLNVEECKYQLGDNHNCKLLSKFEELCNFGITEEVLWEEVIKLKKNWLKKLSAFLQELKSSEKTILREKEAEIEKNMNSSIIKLKRKMTEKSLQVIINSTEGKLLDSEIEKLVDKVLEGSAQEGTLNDAASFLHENNDSFQGNEKASKDLKNYLNLIRLKSYQEFLKEKLKELEKEAAVTKRKDDWKEFKNGEEAVKLAIKDFDSIVDDLNALEVEEKEIGKDIIHHHDKFECLLRLLKEEAKRKTQSKDVEVAAQKLKLTSEKQLEILSETPLEAFRTLENHSSTALFECESAAHCLRNYGGEFKHFFSAMLIPPFGDVERIYSEVSRRKQMKNDIKKFICEKERLATRQRKIQNELNSISYDSQLCDNNFKESDGLLWNFFIKTDELIKETDFIEKILKNWVEQPYRLMIKETPEGKNLKEFEEEFRKGKN